MAYAFLRGFTAHRPYQCALPEGFIVQQEGAFWLHLELHDSLLFSLDALQDVLNNLQDTLPPLGETQPFKVDPNSFWHLRLAGVNTESKVISASSALQSCILVAFAHI